MPAFLENIAPFYGTHEKNEDGQDLETFLEEYDPKKYDNPSLTVDTLVFRHKKDFHSIEKGLKLLMIKRKNHPSIGFWALPGGFVNIREDVETAAKRELEEETGLTGISVSQLFTWGDAWRDPRARIVTVAYLALVEENLTVQAGDDAADALWFDVILRKLGKKNSEKLMQSSYELILSNEDRKLELKSVVEISQNRKGIIKEKSYQVIDSEGIAFDHPRFIVQALQYIEEQL